MAKETVVIVGANSFIGKAVAKWLSKRNAEVLAIVRGDNSTSLHGLEYKTVSVSKYEESAQFFTKGCIVLNCVGLRDSECQLNFELAFSLNGELPGVLYAHAASLGCKKYIHLSTVHVYGPLCGVLKEDSSIEPKGVYGRSKLMGENLIMNLHSVFQSDCRVLIVRLSNVFGFVDDLSHPLWGQAIPNFCLQAYRNGMICIGSPPDTQRDFVPIDYFCYCLCSHLTSTTGIRNFSTGIARSLLQSAHIVASVYSQTFKGGCTVFYNRSSFASSAAPLCIESSFSQGKEGLEHFFIDEIKNIFYKLKGVQ